MVVDYAGLIGEFFGGPGFKIPLGSRDRIISKLHDALDKVLADPTVLSGLGQAARARVLQDFTWTAKARQIARVMTGSWRESRNPPRPCCPDQPSGINFGSGAITSRVISSRRASADSSDSSDPMAVVRRTMPPSVWPERMPSASR